ncbi:MAG: DMT family transporter [Lentisphaeria bacterium]|nr:DMT family transporter [Lentisphaeria bacterium]
MNKSLIGCAAGIVSAVTFGMNPLFGLPLYKENIGPASVLFYRFFFASIMLAVYMLITRKSFRFDLKLLPHVFAGGILLALTCLAWFCSFRIMDSGIGATIMFVYPIMVAAIMIAGFKEKLTLKIVVSAICALAGVAVLCRPGEGATVNAPGIIYALLSALFYAVYIVILKVTRLKTMLPETLTFCTMALGALVFLVLLRFGADLQMLRTWSAFGNALGVAFFPSLLSFLLIAVAVKYIGATRSAILGALEPMTAVVIGIAVFSEKFTWALLAGIILILSSVVIVICGKEQKDPSAPLSENN